jgi:hypothetical protein
MRRAHLDTTAYGDVQSSAPGNDTIPEEPSLDRETDGDDRWVIRRSAIPRQLVLEARSLFEERLERSVSENEARNLLGNLGDYMWVLVKWEVGTSDPGLEKPVIRQRGRPCKPRKPQVAPRPRGRPRKNPKPDSS